VAGKSTKGTKSTASDMDPAALRATADALDKEADALFLVGRIRTANINWDRAVAVRTEANSIEDARRKPILATALANLAAIERSDPVADLAARLIDNGITDEAIWAALRPRLNTQIGNELYNKYRDLSHDRQFPVENHYQVRRVIKRKSAP
jgi:hypothetical protein